MVEQAFHDLGNRLTQALVSGDFGLYASVMALPLRIVPRGGAAYTLETPAALEQDFALYHQSIRTAGVTDIFRDIRHVEPGPGGTARVFCTVHILARANRITEPFASEMLLVRGLDGFRIAEIIATSQHIDWTLGRGPIGPGDGLI